MKNKVIACLSGMLSFGIGFFVGGKVLVGMINDHKLRMQRNLSNMMLFNDWLEFLYSGGSIEQYFYDHGYKKIMIYGNGYVGKRLYQALEKTNIKIPAIMDRIVPTDGNDMVIGIDSLLPDVDCIVVTPIFYYQDIYDMLHKRTDIPIISIKDVIDQKNKY